MTDSSAEYEEGEILSDTDSGELTSTEDVGFSLQMKDLEELSSVEEVFSSDSDETRQKIDGQIEKKKKKRKAVDDRASKKKVKKATPMISIPSNTSPAKPVRKATVVVTAVASPRKCKRKHSPSTRQSQSMKSTVKKVCPKRVPESPSVRRSLRDSRTRARPRKPSYEKGKNIVDELVSAVSQSHRCLPNSGPRKTGADLRKRLLKLGMVKNSGSESESSTDIPTVDLSVVAVPDTVSTLTDTAQKVESSAELVLPVDVKDMGSLVSEESQVSEVESKVCDEIQTEVCDVETKVGDEIKTGGEIQTLTVDVDSDISVAEDEDIEALRAMALRSNPSRVKAAADPVVVQDVDEDLWSLRINALKSAMLRKCAARKKAKDLAAKQLEVPEGGSVTKASSSEVDPLEQDTLTEPIDMDLAESDEDSEVQTIECENQDLFYALYADDAANYVPEAWAPLDKQDEDMKNNSYADYASPNSSGVGLYDDPSSFLLSQPFPTVHSDQMFSISAGDQHLASTCVVLPETVSCHGDAASRKISAQRPNLNSQRPNLIQVPITARPEAVAGMGKARVEQQQLGDISTNTATLVVRKEIGDRCYLGTPPLGLLEKIKLVKKQSVVSEQPLKKKFKKPTPTVSIPTNPPQAIVAPRHTLYSKNGTGFARNTAASKGKATSSTVDSNYPRFVIPLMARDSDSDDEILPDRSRPLVRTVVNDIAQMPPSLPVAGPVSSYQKDSQFDRKVEAFLKSTRKKHDDQQALTGQASIKPYNTVLCAPTGSRSLASSTATSSTSVALKSTTSVALKSTTSVALKRQSVPSTSVPAKSVPSKPVLPNLVPSKIVPAKPLPSTSVPSKSMSSKPVPSTPMPSKPVPSTPMPSKSVPLTSVPSKSVLSTPVPSKSVPSKSVPSTSVPSTSVLLKSLPPKSVPSKPVPSKPVPSMPLPSKSMPTKLVLSTSVPSKSVPSKSVPSKSVPSKLVPSKLVPSKLVPSKSVPSKSVPSITGPHLSPVMATGTVSLSVNQPVAKELLVTPPRRTVAVKRASQQAPPLLVKGGDSRLASRTTPGTFTISRVSVTPVTPPSTIPTVGPSEKKDTVKRSRIADPKGPWEPMIVGRSSQSSSPVSSLYYRGVAIPKDVPASKTVPGLSSIEKKPRQQGMLSQAAAAVSVDAHVRTNLQQSPARVGAPLVSSIVAYTSPERLTFATHVKKIGADLSRVRDAQLVINYQHQRIAESKRAIEEAKRTIKIAKEIIDKKREVVVDQWGELQPKLGVLKLRSRILSAVDSYNIHGAQGKCDRKGKLHANRNQETCNEVLKNAEQLKSLLKEDLEASKENGIEWPVVRTEEPSTFAAALRSFEPEFVAVDIMCPYGVTGECDDEGCLFAHL